VPSAASTSSAWWTFQGCKGPWSRQHQDNSNNGIPGRQGQTAASAALPHYGLGVTGRTLPNLLAKPYVALGVCLACGTIQLNAAV